MSEAATGHLQTAVDGGRRRQRVTAQAVVGEVQNDASGMRLSVAHAERELDVAERACAWDGCIGGLDGAVRAVGDLAVSGDARVGGGITFRIGGPIVIGSAFARNINTSWRDTILERKILCTTCVILTCSKHRAIVAGSARRGFVFHLNISTYKEQKNRK